MKNINRCSLFAIRSSLFAFLIRNSSFLIRNSFLIPPSSFLILLLFSCSPQSRLQRLVSRHPELRLPDTLIVRDTLISPSVQADTLLHIEQLYDTAILEKERLQVKLIRKLDTLYLNGTCLPDTIIVEKKIPVEKIKLIKEPFNLKPVLWLLGALIILIMILSIVKRL